MPTLFYATLFFKKGQKEANDWQKFALNKLEISVEYCNLFFIILANQNVWGKKIKYHRLDGLK